MPADDVVRIAVFIAASTLVLGFVIVLVGGLRGRRAPSWGAAIAAALAISALGIFVGKYGQNFGAPWWLYYGVPVLATVAIPPLLFKFSPPRSMLYVLLAFATAPLLHAAFFYLLGWPQYMPFLQLPPLSGPVK